jgi:penicillin amidase/acyl-homoserine-lactone acylase
LVKEAQEVLRNWDGDTAQNSRGAALAVITGTRALGYEYIKPEADPMEMLKKTAEELKEKFGRLDPEWGKVNRIQHGDVNLPLDGGPDVLRAIYADRDGVVKEGFMNAFAGDTHIMYADWSPQGELTLQSIHQYGAATMDENSPHYDDQAPLFARGEYKRMPMTLEQVLPTATRDYRPGK